MTTVFLMIVTYLGYIAAYHLYGRFISRRIFKVSNAKQTPAHRLNDGSDYVPTRREVIFGHHYASIAGTGPIVGPAIGVIWGWVPALLWIFFGSIFMGAVHDFGALVVSLRNDGRSIAECSARYISKQVRYIFYWVIFLELLIVIAIFGLVIAIVFSIFPSSVLPVWLQIPIAVTLGYWVYRRRGSIMIGTIAAVLAMYATVVLGSHIPFEMPDLAGMPATGLWTILLLIYAFVASTLRVTTLLQPRDFINAWQLTIAMGLLVLGVVASGLAGRLEIVAPAFNPGASGAPPIWPFLFITVACGAVSGFHSIVSSGTSAKQLDIETDSLFVGYGSMLMEGALATVVLIAVMAGIGIAYDAGDAGILSGTAAWQHHYASWQASSGLGSKISAVVIGSANMMSSIGIPEQIGIAIIGVFIASFAGTTLDTAVRLQRYVIEEIGKDIGLPSIGNRYIATTLAVLTAALLAFVSGADGKGALTLWPMFGGVNQLLAALALLTLTSYLRSKGGKGYLVTMIPCIFMLVMTIWAVACNEINFIGQSDWLLATINGGTLLLSIWMVIESLRSGFAAR